MMAKCRSLPIALFCLLVATPAMATEDDVQCNGRGIPDVGTIYFPDPVPPGAADRSAYREEIAISDNGNLTLNGRTTEFVFLRADLLSILGGGHSEVAIMPAAGTQFLSVVPVIGLLNELEQCQSNIVDHWEYGEVFGETRLNPALTPPPPPPFSVLYDLTVTVEFASGAENEEDSNEGAGCHAFFFDREVSSRELQELAYERLVTVVYRLGGLDATPRKAMNAIIQARASTPWRCIAGAIYNIQVAGYSNADLVILPEDQPAAAETPSNSTVDLFEVGYGPADANGETPSRCHIYFDRRTAVYGERIVEAFAGGNVMVHGDFQPRAHDDELAQSGGVGPTAAVLARPDTPWRCVAAATYAIQTAGYANVGFISQHAD